MNCQRMRACQKSCEKMCNRVTFATGIDAKRYRAVTVYGKELDIVEKLRQRSIPQ